MSEISKTFIRNGFFRAIIETVTLLSGVLLVMLLARWLGPDGYGRLSFAFAFMALFAAGIGLGFPLIFVREGAKRMDFLHEKAATGLALQGIMSLGLFIVLVLIIMVSPSLRQDTTLLVLAFIYTMLTVITGFFCSFFQAVQKMHIEAVAIVIKNILIFIIVFILLSLKKTAEAALYGYVLASILSIFITAILVRKYLFAWKWVVDWQAGRMLLAQSWPLLGSAIFTSIYISLDSIMLHFLQDDKMVGIYSAQYRIVFVVYVFFGWYMQSIFPIFSNLFTTAREQFKCLLEASIQHMAAFAYLFGLIMIFFAYHIVHFFYGEMYFEGIFILKIW